MYLLRMDQITKDDITAAAAAHQELGPHFDGAVAESLVERIGAEIDKRVDARIGGPAPAERRPRPVRRTTDSSGPSPLNWPATILALGSMGLGIGATAVVLNPGGGTTGTTGEVGLAVLIWIIIGIINVANARRR
jgi:hypothetical protein